jgi:hypothetical protein
MDGIALESEGGSIVWVADGGMACMVAFTIVATASGELEGMIELKHAADNRKAEQAANIVFVDLIKMSPYNERKVIYFRLELFLWR